jgi:predicted nucleic acid-binding protein
MTLIFVDTGAWFARFVPTDRDHLAARDWFERNADTLVTTDYVVDELLTLLKVRGEFQRALVVGPPLLGGELCSLEFVTRGDVESAWNVFSRHQDKGWSFTDCVSRVVMERLHVTIAVAFDEHFRQFGTVRVVP